MTTRPDPTAAIKTWLFPILMSGFAGLIWQDVTEIKADVKLLMAQSNIDKTRIDALERAVYNKTVSLNEYKAPFPPGDYPKEPIYIKSALIKPEDDPVKVVTEKRKLI